MKRSRSLVVAALVGLLLVVFVPGASAGGPPTVTHQIVDETVNWSLPIPLPPGPPPAWWGPCAETPYPVSGTGQRHKVIITTVYADGSTLVRTNDLVKGTASDSSGTYKFSYTNQSSDFVPAGSNTHTMQMTDTFIMNGNGVAKLNVGFNWRWTYDPTAPPWYGYWPPVDNWQKLSTRGDPFTCDPI